MDARGKIAAPPLNMRLRPLRTADERAAVEAHAELAAEGFPFLLGWSPQQPWSEYVGLLARIRLGQDLFPRWVASSFLIADVGGALVGRVSIRHRLNDFLENFGGHIGYAVRPAYRGRGYATAILRHAIIIARAEGVEDALVTCEDRNLASAAIIERVGGVLEDVRIDPEGMPMRRYWIR